MKLFKWRRREENAQSDEVQEQVDFLQTENDTLLDQVESLKLDVSELTAENQRLLDRLNRSKFQRSIIKTVGGFLALVLSYILLILVHENPNHIVWLLLIEAIFIFLMLRGDEK
ncbi:hypothetical protein [Eupransor demetentiae]|uniref:Uncharacterized protein n=1 Tax=Eupransor demetentiae TaxID=3109584 RepID=A0ABM9N6E9_9LACO|nr:hypothetical protein R54876_GBNLAHCA_01352 [Lactobacillaceae bacterium LMG 33000]